MRKMTGLSSVSLPFKYSESVGEYEANHGGFQIGMSASLKHGHKIGRKILPLTNQLYTAK